MKSGSHPTNRCHADATDTRTGIRSLIGCPYPAGVGHLDGVAVLVGLTLRKARDGAVERVDAAAQRPDAPRHAARWALGRRRLWEQAEGRVGVVVAAHHVAPNMPGSQSWAGAATLSRRSSSHTRRP